ncbi:RNA-binding transcriptional accessory protein [Acutalibacter sp. 1XD8-33]|uniref:Tex family protein n=1 Tax=Acutalibacter sp. 1XD8-33 TaxID=2320081 RepID=UPI000EA3F160|nr:Tex family protein [Acutalibacter sp. 1XD8-33]RKJ41733.1 RNA-binding transcriptional accessory protein [Acutalibacter sp. 1XD8-33]
MDNMIETLAQELNVRPDHAQAVADLLDQGNTVPFIARYRKEQHGAMDDQAIRLLADRLQYLRGLEQRKAEVLAAVAAQEKLTPELESAVASAKTMAEVEDLYRPYRPKRKTRASVARERGLEPLAQALFTGKDASGKRLTLSGLQAMAEALADPEKDLPDAAAALQGAKDIVAEDFSDSAEIRKRLRENIARRGSLRSTANTEEDTVYRLYYEFQESLRRLQSHQILAMDRGEREGILRVSVEPGDWGPARMILRELDPRHPFLDLLGEVAEDAWDRLIFPSLEREVRKNLTGDACEQAIHTFALNLRPLLMQPPVRGKVTLGFDPAYRTGCKLAVVDETGKVLETAVIYPTKPHNKVEESKKVLRGLCDRHGITCIAIGNGTAGRESELFVSQFIQEYGKDVSYAVVSEAGASVYSASKLGAQEFPDYDVSLRSAVSIARRLQDPLAELVKIDPKAIGVGQYQHDMPGARLSETLDGVVEDCVNAVGVDLNTASPSLLRRVAGISPTVAQNVTVYREENGSFQTRRELLKVPKLGPKAFEQCAGFLRVPESKNVLDHTAVHPESYKAAEKLLGLCGYTLVDVGQLSELDSRLKEFGLEKAAEDCGVGLPTLRDIAAELQKPGRDPRDQLPPPLLRTDVMDISDLKPGMKLTGTVRNVVDFGAFVDIGVHQDGLVHVSQLSDRFVRRPSEVVTVGDVVDVTVLEVDEKKKRISLSMKRQEKG